MKHNYSRWHFTFIYVTLYTDSCDTIHSSLKHNETHTIQKIRYNICECHWQQGSECNSQPPFISAIFDSISSKHQFEGISKKIIPDSSVYDIPCLPKSNALGKKDANIKKLWPTTHCITFSELHPAGRGGRERTNKGRTKSTKAEAWLAFNHWELSKVYNFKCDNLCYYWLKM